jgi:uncharacterized protein (DUF924 family)
MRQSNLGDLRLDHLVDRFAEIGFAQSKALDADDTAKFNRLFDKLMEVEKELKQRSGDQRKALTILYSYPNMQVRLNAAKATLSVAPQAARQAIEAIAASTWPPQCYDARMCLWMLDEGKFVPD